MDRIACPAEGCTERRYSARAMTTHLTQQHPPLVLEWPFIEFSDNENWDEWGLWLE
jgi:hypothetical protein